MKFHPKFQQGQLLARDHLQLFDYKQIVDNYDAYFHLPTNAYCGGENAQHPQIPSRYQYRGEYSSRYTNASTPIFLNYDVDWNVVRFDWTPTEFVHSDKDPSFKLTHVYDASYSSVYEIDLVTGQCTIGNLDPSYQGDGIEPLELLWPPKIHERIRSRQLHYMGVQPCRRMVCDVFAFEEPRGSVEHIYEYSFATEKYTLIPLDNPSHVEHNAFTHVNRIRTENGKLQPDHYKAIDIFGYMDQRSVYWEYDIVAPCFFNVGSKWGRLMFTPDSPDAFDYIHNDYFRIAMLEGIRQNASNISPVRISDLSLRKSDDGSKVICEFKFRENHPEVKHRGPSAGDALKSLSEGVSSGMFQIEVVIPSSGDIAQVTTFVMTADPNLDQCKKPCSAEEGMIPTIQLDVGALVGTIIGSILAGLLVIGVVLTIVVSKKHGVPMKSLYIGTVPGTGVSHDLPTVSMSSGISVTNDDKEGFQ